MAAACHSRRRTAHPRSRGENQVFDPTADGDDGSSPLTRGKLTGADNLCSFVRLIPAHAGKTWARPHLGIPSTAHPRSRGENCPAAGILRRWWGSSPLTRGKQDTNRRLRAGTRLIPAHAGKTALAALGIAICGAHPRSRGENKIAGAFFNSEAGSSPLTRGKRTERTDRIFRSGLIPAHAGKTAFTPRAGPSRAAHPRSRGENSITRIKSCTMPGSSPLTRGKQAVRPLGPRDERLIPAHAGKTTRASTRPSMIAAHPRSRGENARLFSVTAPVSGSSPLTRGKLKPVVSGTPGPRLIPAHAGKTPRRSSAPTTDPAHPRSRGENTRALAPTPTPGGSSPLTRGKPPAVFNPSEHTGLIPAHAGKTGRRESIIWLTRAHPRSRGENVTREYASACQLGSSPLTRGKRTRSAPPHRRRRLIPAHAGKTIL